MREGLQILLDLLRGELCNPPATESEWNMMLSIAEAENLLPWAIFRLRSGLLEIPEPVRQRINEIERRIQLAGFIWSSALRCILSSFHKAGLPVIPLKGPWMAERLYGSVDFRSCSDLDLLVRPSDTIPAESLLSSLGFLLQDRGDVHHRTWHNGTLCIELHHDVADPLILRFNLGLAWSRAVQSHFQGVPALLFAPEDELLFLCIHAARHNYDRLSLVLDILMAVRHSRLSFTTVRNHVPGGLENVFAFGLLMALHLDGGIEIGDFMPRRVRERQRLQRLADQIWNRRMSVVPLARRRDELRLFSQLEKPGWRRLQQNARHLRLQITRVDVHDFAIAAKFHLHRRWQVRLLRPFILMLKTLGF